MRTMTSLSTMLLPWAMQLNTTPSWMILIWHWHCNDRRRVQAQAQDAWCRTVAHPWSSQYCHSSLHPASTTTTPTTTHTPTPIAPLSERQLKHHQCQHWATMTNCCQRYRQGLTMHMSTMKQSSRRHRVHLYHLSNSSSCIAFAREPALGGGSTTMMSSLLYGSQITQLLMCSRSPVQEPDSRVMLTISAPILLQ